jgi:hypothetical protein
VCQKNVENENVVEKYNSERTFLVEILMAAT